MSRGKKKRTLRDLSRERPSLEEIGAIHEEADNGNDRTAAILLAISVENKLRDSLFSKLSIHSEFQDELTGRDGPMSSFSQKILLGFVLGLYDANIQAEMRIIRHIRNAFAHSERPITFTTPEIAEACKKLRTIFLKGHSAGKFSKYDPAHFKSRDLYTATCIALENYLITKTLKREKARRRQERKNVLTGLLKTPTPKS